MAAATPYGRAVRRQPAASPAAASIAPEAPNAPNAPVSAPQAPENPYLSQGPPDATTGQGFNESGNVYSRPATPTSSRDAFQQALAQGKRGEGVVDYLKGLGIQDSGAYYPESGFYGFDGWYATPGNDGQYNLTDRAAAGPGVPYGGLKASDAAIQMPNGGGQLGGGGNVPDPFAAIGGWTPPSAAAPATQPTTPFTTGGQEPKPNPIQDAYRAALLKLLQTPQTVDAAGLAASPEAAAQRLQSQRGAERQQRDLAAQAGAEGWAGSGAMSTARSGIGQQRSEADSSFVGQLAISKMQQQQQALMQGVQLAQQQGQFDMAQQLQEKLANLDAAIKREALAQSGQLGNADLQLRSVLGQGGLDLQRQALIAQMQQANNSLGFNYWNAGNNLNWEKERFGASGGTM